MELINKAQHAINIKDVISFSEDNLKISLTKPTIKETLNVIETAYTSLSLEAYIKAAKDFAIHHPLHIAARDGNTDEISRLVNDGFGYDVNQTDKRSITPLHVAVTFGQMEAAKTLLALGAKVDAKGYQDHTPLHFALAKGHYDIAIMLIAQHHADPLAQNYQGTNGFTLVFDALEDLLNNSKNEPKFNQAIELLEVMIQQSNAPLFYNVIEEVQKEYYVTGYPLSMVLQFAASFANTPEQANKFLSLIDLAQAHDSSDKAYNYAKDLLHRFPTGGIYQTTVSTDKSMWLLSEGHAGIYTTHLASLSLQAFVGSDFFDNADLLKAEVFSSLLNIFQNANEFTQFSGIPETSEKALDLFNQGQTVLLPSGWDGHFIDIILSKNQLLYVVANSGDRYHGESPDYIADPAGINFYQMYEPEQISPQFIYNILNNTDKTFLEFENAYEYGVFERIEEISRESQQYGNCGWESHRDAVEGLIYIELLDKEINPQEAKALASAYYQEWDSFHGNYVIEQYLDNSPGLPVEAMIDIFNQLHLKPNFTTTDHMHAQKIAQALVSPHYIEAFQGWMKEVNESESFADKLMLNILQQQHGIDITCVQNEGSQCSTYQPTVAQESIVVENIMPVELHPVHFEV